MFCVRVQASTQTDAMRLPMPRRRQMKNKWVLCRPFTMDQATTCRLPEPPSEPTGNYEETLGSAAARSLTHPLTRIYLKTY